MGFLGGMISGIVKVGLSPIAIVKDGVSVVTGDDVDATKNLISSVGDDISDAADDLSDGDVI